MNEKTVNREKKAGEAEDKRPEESAPRCAEEAELRAEPKSVGEEKDVSEAVRRRLAARSAEYFMFLDD